MKKTTTGFTIVELLIVIIVIAILATITVVAYNGIQKRAAATAMQSELTQVKKAAEVDKPHFGGYPADFPEDTQNAVNQNDTIISHYYQRSSGQGFCADSYSTKHTDLQFHVDNTTDTVQEGLCTENTYTPPSGGSGGSTDIANNTPIQNVTSAQCQALPTFTGANDAEAVRTVTDTRGGTTRTYRIAKLADNNCWMLDNLKLGSTSSSITLTPADSNVSSNFVLPRLYNGVATSYRSYDVPHAFGPVPGDTGSGATNYGYLYNWPAATAGESRTSHPAGAGDAPSSICAAGWRLPSSGSPSSDFGQLDQTFGGTGAASFNNPPSLNSWRINGSFKGVESGSWHYYHDSTNWVAGFRSQGSGSINLWSKSAHASDSVIAYYFLATSNNIYPTYQNTFNGRSLAFAVRCLLG